MYLLIQPYREQNHHSFIYSPEGSYRPQTCSEMQRSDVTELDVRRSCEILNFWCSLLAPKHTSHLLHPHTACQALRSTNQGLLIVPCTRLKACGVRASQTVAPQLWNLLSLALCAFNVSNIKVLLLHGEAELQTGCGGNFSLLL